MIVFLVPHVIVYIVLRMYLDYLQMTKTKVYVLEKKRDGNSNIVCTDTRSKDTVVNVLDDLHVSPIRMSVIVGGVQAFKNNITKCQVWMSVAPS